MLQRMHLLRQGVSELDELSAIDVPGRQHIFLAVGFGTQLLLGLNFHVAPMPDGDGGLFFFVALFFVFVFLG